MANFILNYLIRSAWEGKRATDQAGRDLESLGKKGDQAAKGTDKASGALSNFDSKISGLVTGGALIAAGYMIADFASEAIDAASDVEEAYGKYNVVFGQFADSTEAALTQIADVTKRSKYDLIEYAATLQDTFVPLGFARGEAAAMSEQLVQLSIDLASFNNVAEADVVRDLQSALVGNTETLRKYGVIANDASIKQEALELGLWDGVGAVDAQTKAQSILSLTLKGTTDAQGDAERTADSYANVSRDLDSALKDLSVTVGTQLLPSATKTQARMAELTRQATDFLESQIELEDGLGKLNQAYQDGVISQELYNKAAQEIQWSMEGAGDAYYWANKLIEQEAEYLGRSERAALAAADADRVLTQGIKDRADESERMQGIAYQNGRTSMQNADLVRIHTERIDEQTAATKALALEQEEAAAIAAAAYQQTYTNAFIASEQAIESTEDLSAAYKAMATEALIANSGATDSTIDLMVALGELTPEVADARKEYAFMATEMKAFADSADFAALSIERQKQAIEGLESGRYDTAEQAIEENVKVENINLQYDNLADFYDEADGISDKLQEVEDEPTIPVVEVDTNPFQQGYDDVKAWMADLAKGVTVPIRSRDDTGGGTGGGSVGGGSQPPEHSFVGSGSNNLTLVTSGKAATNIAISYWDQKSRLTQAAGHSRR